MIRKVIEELNDTKIKAVLFDLDGTLLPMDLDEFFENYFKLLAAKLYPYGYTDSKKLIKVVVGGVYEAIKNDGTRYNGEVFWDFFDRNLAHVKLDNKAEILDEFYRNEFNSLKSLCGFNPKANRTVKLLKQKGIRTVVATKPIFPPSAIESRMEWAGLELSDFEYYTDYDKCRYCKPDVGYYKEIADRLGVLPSECLMVGNDVSEDMTAMDIGMRVFLLTDCLINSENKDLSSYNKGGFDELVKFIEQHI